MIAAAKPSCTPYCLSAFGLRTEVRGASASRHYGAPGGFSLSGVRKRHLDNSPAQPFQKNSPKVGKCSGRRAGVPVIYSLALHAPCAVVAQLVEQLTRNEQVTGSSPVNGSMNSQRPASQRAFSYLRLVAAYSAGVSLPALFIRRCNRGRWCRRRACGNYCQGRRWQYPVQREEGRYSCSGRLPERRRDDGLLSARPALPGPQAEQQNRRRRFASAKKLGRNFYDPSKPLVVYLEQMFVVATLGFIHIQVGLVQYC